MLLQMYLWRQDLMNSVVKQPLQWFYGAIVLWNSLVRNHDFVCYCGISIDGCGTACDLFPNQSQCPTPPMHIKFVKLIPYVIPCSWLHVRIKEGLLHSSINIYSPLPASSGHLQRVSGPLNLSLYYAKFYAFYFYLHTT